MQYGVLCSCKAKLCVKLYSHVLARAVQVVARLSYVGFPQNVAAAPAINVSHGVCEIARDYQKKKNALRLKYAINVCWFV